ncbi:MAG TPA: adenosylmethionine decarboxylase, partial [Firmicutes bacterium]|nr:adenosylmethionine decarboxylase [Bacillota bacterium]
SGVVVISESHQAIHTWPEYGYAAVDVFTCGDRVDPWVACNYLKVNFAAGNMDAREIKRGIFQHEASGQAKVANF